MLIAGYSGVCQVFHEAPGGVVKCGWGSEEAVLFRCVLAKQRQDGGLEVSWGGHRHMQGGGARAGCELEAGARWGTLVIAVESCTSPRGEPRIMMH